MELKAEDIPNVMPKVSKGLFAKPDSTPPKRVPLEPKRVSTKLASAK